MMERRNKGSSSIALQFTFLLETEQDVRNWSASRPSQSAFFWRLEGWVCLRQASYTVHAPKITQLPTRKQSSLHQEARAFLGFWSLFPETLPRLTKRRNGRRRGAGRKETPHFSGQHESVAGTQRILMRSQWVTS